MDFNILFTSSGRRVSLIRHFKKTLSDLRIEGKIVTIDAKPTSPTSFVSDFHELVPKVSDDSYIHEVLRICKKYNIRLLVPLIDNELSLFSKFKPEFEIAGTTVLVSSEETNEICFDKENTYEYFARIGVDTPAVLDPERVEQDSAASFPIFLKPFDGSCSVGAMKINNAEELAFFRNYIPNAMVQEFVSGDEYTLDILVDFEGKVRSVVPRLRLETRAGEVSKGITVKNHELMEAAKYVVESLPGAVGCITVQCFLTADNKMKFIEINPRFGGGFPLAAAAGADFPRWIIQMMLGQQIGQQINDWEDGLVMLRYDDAIYIRKEMISHA